VIRIILYNLAGGRCSSIGITLFVIGLAVSVVRSSGPAYAFMLIC